MIQILTLLWGISAACAWEVQAHALIGRQHRWVAITIGSLLPIYNTLVVLGYVRDELKNRKRWKR